MSDMYAYVWLEIATSFMNVTVLPELWSNTLFFGTDDFRKVMSKDKFGRTRSILRIYPSYDHGIAVIDPLWNSPTIMDHLSRNFESVEAPLGVI